MWITISPHVLDDLWCTVLTVYLYSGLAELGPLAELLPGVDVRVLGPLEGLLQLVQLVGGEGGAGAALLPLQGDPRLSLHVHVGALLRPLRLNCSKHYFYSIPM